MILNPWDVQSKQVHTTDGVASTLYAGESTWGGGWQFILEKKMSYQEKTGALMANSHPGSYCGQDAYNDMLITEENGRIHNVNRTGKCRDFEGGITDIEHDT